LPELNVGRENCGIVENDGKIVVVGGRLDADVDSKIGTFEIFEPAKKSWTVFEDEKLKSNEEYVSLLFN
jgi:hypothetical protein